MNSCRTYPKESGWTNCQTSTKHPKDVILWWGQLDNAILFFKMDHIFTTRVQLFIHSGPWLDPTRMISNCVWPGNIKRLWGAILKYNLTNPNLFHHHKNPFMFVMFEITSHLTLNQRPTEDAEPSNDTRRLWTQSKDRCWFLFLLLLAKFCFTLWAS